MGSSKLLLHHGAIIRYKAAYPVAIILCGMDNVDKIAVFILLSYLVFH